ncbi:hypothetical protein QOZ88_12815 [Blastococcus sp. BMG 814]|uniref:4 TMS phage holin, superfamily IV n=1 Tax=Blastococcus carthaginiensis TaxID=3050034 RepID=A0ABT9IEJ0_9ACTN|nr:hypothetical protein [Blastococcus carthaginiensis]MDP5183520.1 hypothetical protein [Blastococcus carthaginiensis]
MTTATTPGRRAGVLTWVLRLVGAVLLAVMGWLHLDLWLDGYRTIDVIGPAFVLNAIAGFGLALLLLVAPRRWLWLAAALGALTALGTLTALLLSTTVGLFGFVESSAAPLWWETFWVELAAVVVLAVLAVDARRRPA